MVRIGQHMNTRVLSVRWPDSNGKPTLMGRPLFDYENTDNWIFDPDDLRMYKPRSFRSQNAVDRDPALEAE